MNTTSLSDAFNISSVSARDSVMCVQLSIHLSIILYSCLWVHSGPKRVK